MQKFVTLFLTDDDEDDIEVQEHLAEYLGAGWKVVSVTPLGAGAGYGGGGKSEADGHTYVAGWLAVVLEK